MLTGKKARILIVDDAPQNSELLVAMLEPQGYLTLTADHGEQALAIVAADPAFDLILLDVMMPGMDGYEVARQLKSRPETCHIPIIMLTALSERDARLTGLEAGAEEFLIKPVDRAELWVRVRNLLRLKAYNDLLANHNALLEDAVQQRTLALTQEIAERKRSEEHAHYLAYHDALTGLPNHALFQNNLNTLLDTNAEKPSSIAVLVIDLDRFRVINETLGRQMGDELLKQVAQRLADAPIDVNYLAHMGAGCFALALLQLSKESAAAHAFVNQILTPLHHPFMVEGIALQISAKVGIARFPADGTRGDVLLRNADIAMYHAKNYGQNPIQWYCPELEAQAQQHQLRRAEIEQRIGRLTPREREIVHLIITGNASKMIAYRLGTSVRTIDAHRARIMEKMQAHTLADLVRMVIDPSVQDEAA